jgi:hypothetical protein
MAWLDLDELAEVFAGRWLWSVERPNWVSFRRRDYLGDPAVPLDRAVRDLVGARAGSRPAGPVRLLTNLRTFGYLQNPVSFYYCFDGADERVEAIVAEVTNTPWGERHPYVLLAREAEGAGWHRRWRFPKAFHVSPFFDMDHEYDWRFTKPGPTLAVHMENLRHGAREFDATLTLSRREIDRRSLSRALLRFPFMTGRVVAAIYWQALCLELRGVPFFPHPRRRAAEGGEAC